MKPKEAPTCSVLPTASTTREEAAMETVKGGEAPPGARELVLPRVRERAGCWSKKRFVSTEPNKPAFSQFICKAGNV